MTQLTSTAKKRPERKPVDRPGRGVRGRTLTFECSAHGATTFTSFTFATINLACGCAWTAQSGGLVPTEYRGTVGDWIPNKRKARTAAERARGFYGEVVIADGEEGAGWHFVWTNGSNFNVAEGRLR